jgi:hypothetical protein
VGLIALLVLLKKGTVPSGMSPGATFALVYAAYYFGAGLWTAAPRWRWTVPAILFLSGVFILLPESLTENPWFLLSFQVLILAIWSGLLVKIQGWKKNARAVWTLGFLIQLLLLPPVPVAKQLAFFGLVSSVTLWTASGYAERHSFKAEGLEDSTLEDQRG